MKLIVGISGASGVLLGYKFLQILKQVPDVETHLVISEGAAINFKLETNLKQEDVEKCADYVYSNKNLAAAISSGSLRGARGNSGVILSQLFRGFTKEIVKYETLDTKAVALGFERAVETAYKAVMKPKEGTILTVAKETAVKAQEAARHITDFAEFGAVVLEHAEYTLSQTPEMLPVLKEAGVVDSGGQGSKYYIWLLYRIYRYA